MQPEDPPPPAAADAGSTHDCCGSAVAPDLVHNPVQQRFPDLFTQSIAYCESIKARFGDSSKVYATIVNTLGEFGAQKISKRQTYDIIRNELLCFPDLQEGLRAILDHVDASWDAQDFQPEPTVADPPKLEMPDFLQPEHHPQLTLPRLNFCSNASTYSASINPTLLSDGGGSHGVYNQDSYHVPSQQTPRPPIADHYQSHYQQNVDQPVLRDHSQYNHEPYPFAQPSPENMSRGYGQHTSSPQLQAHAQPFQLPPIAGFDNGLEYASPNLRGGDTQAYPSYSLNEAWGIAQGGHASLQDFARPLFSNERTSLPADWSQYGSVPPLASPDKGSMHTSPSVLNTPVLDQFREPLFDVASPPHDPVSRHDAYNQKYGIGMRDNGGLDDTGPTAAMTQVPSSHELPSLHEDEDVPPQTAPPPPTVRPSAEFVHSLCGKRFSSRHGVKKHHWGKIMGDLNTTSGCWAKNGKPPGVEWDDHPSCKDQTSKANTSKPLSARPRNSRRNAPAVPMTPLRKGSPVSIPTLQDLPRTVAESLNAYPGSNLDALLTVINVASTMDAPVAQSRNDSVVSRLDAQVAASEYAYHNSHNSLQKVLYSDQSRTSHFNAPMAYRPIAPVEEEVGSYLDSHNSRFPSIANEDPSAHHIQQTATESKKRRRKTRNSSISQKELESLGMDSFPDSKRHRTTNVDGNDYLPRA